MNIDEITENTPYRKILGMPQFAGFEKYLLPLRGIKGMGMRLMKPSSIAMWDGKLIADGFRFLAAAAEKTKIFFPYYDGPKAKRNPSLKEEVLFFLPAGTDGEKRPCVFVCAGGGYSMACNLIEAFPVAEKIHAHGFHAVVVNYRTGKNAVCPNPIEDLSKAVNFVFAQADSLRVLTNRYYVMGFSAAGHLVSNYAVRENGYGQYGAPKPSGVILSYPVIDLGEYSHADTKRQFLGKNHADDEEIVARYTAWNHLTAAYPPVFIWAFDRDDTVNPANSRLFAERAEDSGVRCRLELYPGTMHGASLGTGTACEGWLDRAFAYLGGTE